MSRVNPKFVLRNHLAQTAIERAQQGEAKAAEELLPLVYEELRKLAAHRMAHESPGQTLQPTALHLGDIEHALGIGRHQVRADELSRLLAA